jgi:hypothetical protein
MTIVAAAAWTPGPLMAGQTQVAVARALLAEARAHLAARRVTVETWSGTAAEAAATRHAELVARVDAVGAAVTVLEPALARAAERLVVLEATVRLTELTASLGGGDPSDPTGRDASAATIAHEIDGDLAAAFDRVAGLLTSLPASARGSATVAWPTTSPGPAALLSGTTATPTARVPIGDVVRWWGSLSPGEQDAVVAQRPEVVGPVDGLPGWARDRANRILLDRAEADLTRQAAALQPPVRSWPDLIGGAGGLAGAMTIGTFGGGTRRVAYHQAVAKLAAVRSTRQVLDQRDGETRQLLAFDVSGRSARVAVGVGDVDRAGHVALVVPGFTTTVERDLVGSDRVSADLASLSRRAANLVGDSREVAVVSWLAYDVPQTADTLRSGHSVVLRASAEAGAAPLASFLHGIPPDRHLTLVGHSYGSTTAGLAVAHGDTGVDDVVVLGSPGLGADDGADLGLPPRQVHVLEADDDPVADLGWFGRDPSELTGVDRLSADGAALPGGAAGQRSHGHSGYLVPGTTSQWNVAAVVAGAPTVRVGPPPASW